MAKILAIQFRWDEILIEREQRCLRRELGDEIEIDFISAVSGEYTWDKPEDILTGYHGVILGGSGELDFDGNRAVEDEVPRISQSLLAQLRGFLQYIFEHDIPTLGICYGHQMIGSFAGAQVKYSPTQRKTRSHQLKVVVDTQSCPLLCDLPEVFYAHYGHKDVVDRIPEEATLILSGGESCQVSALQYKRNIYTVQFHPELTYVDMAERIKNTTGYLPPGTKVEEVFIDDASSSKILRNFGSLVQGFSN
jgi:GMP synthase-like glutamine amidotransferase